MAKATRKKDMTEDKQPAELKCITPIGVACFVHVWEPHTFKNSKDKEPAYRMTLVFLDEKVGDMKLSSDLGDIKRIVGNAIKKRFGSDAKELLRKGKIQLPWRDASDYDQYNWPFDVEDARMIGLSTHSAPGIVDERGKNIIKQQEFYAGCLARASVYAHAYDTDGNKGVTLLLNNVQKAGDGKKLAGGRADPTEEFGKLVDDDDDLDDEMNDLLG